MNSRTIGVWLVFRGRDLDPEYISEKLNLTPSRKHTRGLAKQKSPNVIAKTGLWVFESSAQADTVGSRIDEMLEKLRDLDKDVRSINGVEEAFIDVFIAESDCEENRVTTSSYIDAAQINEIARLGLGIKFTS
jgi:hypothetical protein